VSDLDNDKMAEALKKYGINLADLVRDTNADTMMRVMHQTDEMLELTTIVGSGRCEAPPTQMR
jgi:hypothetical protein